MASTYSIKGSAIRMKFEFVRAHFGLLAEAAMHTHFRGRPELEPLLDVTWVPFALYEEINHYIARTHFGGDLARLQEVGAFSADRGLRSIYRSWVRGKAFVEFLGRMGEYYKTFYSAGDLDVRVDSEEKAAILLFRNAPLYSEAEMHIATGFFVGAARVMGLDDVAHTMTRQPTGMELRLRWS